MIPANQRLEAADAEIGQRDNRLVINHQLVLVDGFAQAGFGLEAGDGLLAQSVVEEFKARLAVGLGVIHGGVGVAQQVFGSGAGGAEGDSDAGGDKHTAALEMKRLAEPLEDSRGDVDGVALVLDMAEQDGELIAADARHHRLHGAALAGAGRGCWRAAVLRRR